MRTPVLVGLTGSIGMGKSTTAGLFAKHGIPVWDAEDAVHRLYAKGGAAVDAMARVFPDAIEGDAVDREKLKRILLKDAGALAMIEKVVHPLVAADRAEFVSSAEGPMVVLDIPLLFEAGLADTVDKIVVVSAPADVQRERVLSRPGMTDAQFSMILDKQLPDAEKRRRADYVIETTSLEAADAAVQSVIEQIKQAHHA